MPSEVASRSRDQRALADFLESAQHQSSTLLIRGDAGIGKTTLWLDCLEKASDFGFRVLSARAGQLETVLAYTSVGDLLAQVDSSILDGIPDPQRRALNRVLMLSDDAGPENNQRLVATAFESVVDLLAESSPTLIAIDDVQWLDSSSRSVLAYTVHRLKGRVGVLLTERSERDKRSSMSWLQSASAGNVIELQVGPLETAELHTLIERRLGRSFPRPTMARIAHISGGNPLYALELARAIVEKPRAGQEVFPHTLADLVQVRIERLDDGVLDVLVAAACVHSPTVDLLATVTGATVDEVVSRIEDAESAGIVVLDGNHLDFTHPVLTRGVYLSATPAQRRRWHRSWSEIVTEPETRARHLALAATSSNQATLDALDEAAAVVRARGAPAAAAELLDLAIGLGGDTPMRRFAAAEHHLRSGDAAQAQVVLKPGIAEMPAGPLRALMKFGYAVIVMHIDGYTPAAEILDEAIDDASGTPPVHVVVQMMLAFTMINDGVYDAALRHGRQAMTEAEVTSDPALISQALAVWSLVAFYCGFGYDEPRLQRSLELEDRDGDIPIPFQASAIQALIMAWTGQLEQSAAALEALRKQLVHRGGEIELLFVSYNSALVSVWSGRYGEAMEFAEETFQRVEEIGGTPMRACGLAVRGWVQTHTGREHDARADLAAAIALHPNGSLPWWRQLALMGLGRLEVSAGRYAAALEALRPLLEIADQVPNTEISSMEYLPDAIEAMIATGELDRAEALIDRLQSNGRRFQRDWTLAVAARCRGLWLAATDDVGAALEVVQHAVDEYRRLPMPLEHARTQLLLGRLQRRRRHKGAASTLREALETFETLESPLWAAQARVELARTAVGRGSASDLTPTERRVAELAADGLRNRDIAAAAHISEKTVESNLSRIYRKLGIRSRAELSRRLDVLAQRREGGSG